MVICEGSFQPKGAVIMDFSRYFLFLFVLLFLSLHSKETEKKIYVSPQDLQITEHGFIAFDLSKKLVAGKTLSVDQNGMYIKEWKGPCWLHDLWCRYCGGCGVLLCPMNCTCFD